MSESQITELIASTSRRSARTMILVEMMVVFCLAVLPDLWSALARPPIEHRYTVTLMSARILPRSISICAVLFYLIWRSGMRWSDFGIQRFRFVSDVLGGIGATVVLYVVYYAAFQVIYRVLGAEFYRQLWNHSTAPSSIFAPPETFAEIALLILVQLSNGLAEELAMRGYFITRLEQAFGSPAKALFVSTILFASYHIYQGAIGVIGAAVLGAALGAIFLRFRRLWPVVIAHAGVDLISFLRLKHG